MFKNSGNYAAFLISIFITATAGANVTGTYDGPATARFTIGDKSYQLSGNQSISLTVTTSTFEIKQSQFDSSDSSSITSGFHPTFQIKNATELWFDNGKSGPQKVGDLSTSDFIATADVNGHGWIMTWTGHLVDGDLVYSYASNFGDKLEITGQLTKE